MGALIDEVGAEAVMTRLACIEWFPHPSRRFVRPSQEFAFGLVRSALQRRAVTVTMRSRDLWMGSIPELAGHDPIVLRNKQNPTISPGNMDDAQWRRLVAALREGA